MKVNGLLLVNKIPGGTSHDVVEQVRKVFHLRRVGHTGTLDPQAEGLMVLCLGRATKLQQFLTGLDKIYIGTIKFGYATTTYDGEGERLADPVECHPTLSQLSELAEGYVGTYMQTPPPYSAKRYKGKRLYELARSGEKVPHLEKEISVYDFRFNSVEKDEGNFIIHCGSGTYLRTIAHELGEKIGCGAYLHHLKRLEIKTFSLEQALTVEELSKLEDPTKGSHYIDIQKVRLPFPELKVDTLSGNKLIGGQKITCYDPDFKPDDKEGLLQVVSPSGSLICIANFKLDGKEIIVIEPKVVISRHCD